MDFESFKNKYNNDEISYFRKSKLRFENEVDSQISLFVEEVLKTCKNKVLENDYPLIINNPWYFNHYWYFGEIDGPEYYRTEINYKRETMFRAVEEMNKNGWKIKIKKRFHPFSLIESLIGYFKNRTIGYRTYKLVIYNN